MPFTPFHFGLNGLVGWPVKRWVDWPVLVLASVAVDVEPLLVMYYKFNVPVHWLCHTFLFGAVVGCLWGLVAYQLRDVFRFGMRLLRLPYNAELRPMITGGVLGAWLHVFVDAFVYADIRPFWPLAGNPLYRLLSRDVIWFICDACLIGVVVVYVVWRVRYSGRSERRPPLSAREHDMDMRQNRA